MGFEGLPIGLEDLLKMKFCHDSRRVEKGCVFVAIKGERHDGHDFVEEALEKGAALAIVERKIETGKEIVVEDVIEFLLDLASRKLKADIVVGITGSSGKTFTKELIAKLIPGSFKSRGNMNTEIGLPLSILNEYRGERVAVLEMGMNRRGDIKRLSGIAKPNVGVILNVGVQHVGKVGSLEEIFKGKMEMVDVSKKIVFNADDGRIVDYVSRSSKESLGFGSARGDVVLKGWRYEGWSTVAEYDAFGEKISVKVDKFWHRGHLLNLSAALCVLRLLEMDFKPDLLKNFRFPKMRFHQKFLDGIFVIDDTYNASLSAFEVAIESIEMMPFKGKFAVVGPVKELGNFSREVHGKISSMLETLDGVFVYSKDEEAEFLKPKNEIFRSPDPEELAEAVLKTVRGGDLVIFKASRSVMIEDVLERFEGLMRKWS